jgi:hypothetical protein
MTDQSVDLQWKDYQTFLVKKAEMLKDEIDVKEMRGIESFRVIFQDPFERLLETV